MLGGGGDRRLPEGETDHTHRVPESPNIPRTNGVTPWAAARRLPSILQAKRALTRRGLGVGTRFARRLKD